MSRKIEVLTQDLREIISSYDELFLEKFEETLYDLSQLNNHRIISKLIPLLKDDFEYDELMFSVIHTVEVFEDDIYINELFMTLPNFIYQSPRWASIIFMRILNNENSFKVFKTYFSKLNKEKKDSIQALFYSMSKIDEEISNLVSPFLK